jgi:hypothetical protein
MVLASADRSGQSGRLAEPKVKRLGIPLGYAAGGAFLIVLALWWTARPGWQGGPCDRKPGECIDGIGSYEDLYPLPQWVITVFADLVVAIGASLLRPVTRPARFAWAALIATGAGLANRHNLYWCVLVTVVIAVTTAYPFRRASPTY